MASRHSTNEQPEQGASFEKALGPLAFQIPERSAVVAPNTVEQQLEELNALFDQHYRTYIEALNGSAGRPDADPVWAAFNIAATHAIRAVQTIRWRATLLSPITLRGFALKARLITDSAEEWETGVGCMEIISSLIGQLLGLAELAPIDRLRDDTAPAKMLEDAKALAAGKAVAA